MADIILGGRLYAPVNEEAVTLRHHQAQLAAMLSCGIDTVLPEVDEAFESYCRRLVEAVARAGKTVELASLYLLPAGKSEDDWSPEMAQEIGEQLGGIKGDTQRQQVYDLVAEMVFRFFHSTSRSLVTSLSSSASNLGVNPDSGTAAH